MKLPNGRAKEIKVEGIPAEGNEGSLGGATEGL